MDADEDDSNYVKHKSACLAECQDTPLNKLHNDFIRKISRAPTNHLQHASSSASESTPQQLLNLLSHSELESLAFRLDLKHSNGINSRLITHIRSGLTSTLDQEQSFEVNHDQTVNSNQMDWAETRKGSYRPLFHDDASVNFPALFTPVLGMVDKINSGLQKISRKVSSSTKIHPTSDRNHRKSSRFTCARLTQSFDQLSSLSSVCIGFETHLQQERAYLQGVFSTGIVCILAFSACYSIFITIFELYYSAIASYCFFILLSICLAFTMTGTAYEISVNMSLFFLCAVFVAFPAFSGGVVQSGFLTAGGALVPVWAVIYLHSYRTGLYT